VRHRERRRLRDTYKAAASADMDGAESDVSGLALVMIGELTLW
jgi:hypothetical protein